MDIIRKVLEYLNPWSTPAEQAEPIPIDVNNQERGLYDYLHQELDDGIFHLDDHSKIIKYLLDNYNSREVWVKHAIG